MALSSPDENDIKDVEEELSRSYSAGTLPVVVEDVNKSVVGVIARTPEEVKHENKIAEDENQKN